MDFVPVWQARKHPGMKASSTEDKARRFPAMEWLLIFVFAILLWLPTVDYFIGVDRSKPAQENRPLAPRPRLTSPDLAGMEHYLADTEAYFNDHFGYRKRLIRWFQQWKPRLYGSKSVDLVMAGQNSWLFFNAAQMIDHYLGTVKFTPEQLRAWQRLLEKRRDWLAAQGIKYLFVIAPDKQTIYPENLPEWLVRATPANRETKLDQLLQYLKQHSTVRVLDLRPALVAAKEIAPTYLQNDTHWNLFGGFIGSQETVKAMSQQLPDLPPLSLEDFNWSNAPATGGDLARMLGVEAPEKNYFGFTPKPGSLLPTSQVATNIISLWDPGKPSVILENPGPLKETAVIFHDSFGLAWREFLGHSFKRIIFMPDNREFNARVILENHPQIVVNEMLERYVNTLDPAELMTREALP
jgi:hypothetical protein